MQQTMNPIIERANGWTEVILDGDCGFDRFYTAAEILQNNFHLTFTNKLNDLDTLYWDFVYRECKLVLFYNIYEGITIFPGAMKDATQEDNDRAVEIGTLLYQKLISLTP